MANRIFKLPAEPETRVFVLPVVFNDVEESNVFVDNETGNQIFTDSETGQPFRDNEL